MELQDLQQVLDRIVMTYGEISPQILRDVVEYAKMQSVNISIEGDEETGGKTHLFVKSQGYIEGYCHVFDEYYNEDAVDVAVNDITEPVIVGIREDYGEEAPTAIISSCADFASTVAAMRHDDTPDDEVRDVVRMAAVGYMDGTLACASDKLYGRRITSVFNGYPMELAQTAFDMTASETSLVIEDPEIYDEVRDGACACLKEMMEVVVCPKSGNSAIATDDTLICAMMYLLGFLKGLLPQDAVDISQGKDYESDPEKQRAARIAQSQLAVWTRYNGYSQSIFDEASEAMETDALLADMVGPDNEMQANDGTLAMLFGMGFADGKWMMSDDEMSDVQKAELDIATEVAQVLANISPADFGE